MPKKLIKRIFPDMNRIRQHKSLRLFGDRLHDPNLWHLNRRSVAGAFAVGLFSAFVPIPLQMVFAAFLATLFRCNLPISVLLVWISNPITTPPLALFAYKLGNWILGNPPGNLHFEFSIDWLFSLSSNALQPLLLGSLIMGCVASLLGYISVRLYWRYYVLRIWEKRRRKSIDNRKK